MDATNDVNVVRVLDKFVLVKQVMKKKKTAIILDAAQNQKDKFDYSFEIMQLGNKVEREIKVGEHPIFSEYVQFSGVKVLEKNEDGMLSLVIVHEEMIIAIDDDPEIVEWTEASKSGSLLN